MQIAISRRSISSAAASKAVDAAVAKGRERGAAIVAAVVDVGGDLMACLRADGAFSASVGIAKDKAYTARYSARRRTSCQMRSRAIRCCTTASRFGPVSCCSEAVSRSSRTAPLLAG